VPKIQDPLNRLAFRFTMRVEADVGVVRFDSEDTSLAVGCSNGSAQIFDIGKGNAIF